MPEFPCPHCDKVAGSLAGIKSHIRSAHPENYEAPPPAPEAPEGEDAPGEAPPARPRPQEVVPKRPKGWRERFKFSKRAADSAPGTRERPPKKGGSRGKRVPLDTDISDAWAFLGRRLETTPHYPTGRMLQYQAPAAGVIFDKAIAGTLPDRAILQPLARNRDKYEDVAFLLAGPLVTFSITRSYQMLQVAMEQGDQDEAANLQRRIEMQFEGFSWLLNMMLPRLVEGKKIAQEKKAKADAMVADAFPELAGTDQSPADALRDMLFAPPTFVMQAQGGTDGGTAGPAANGSGPDHMAERGEAPSGAGPTA
ncbi:MAG: hypothetical protein ACLQVK_00850 [Acidimicrobiales bacterium]